MLGMAAQVWWELRMSLLFIFGIVIFGVFLSSAIFQQGLKTSQGTETVMVFVVVFTPLGYVSGNTILKYLGAWLEKYLGSDEFDPTYREYAKRHKTAFKYDDKEAFQDFYQAHREKERERPPPNTSYERYSQYRRSQANAERTAPPPKQIYQSDKDRMLAVLEVKNINANAKDVKSAYRKLAWKYHPDVLAKNELSDAQLNTAQTRMQEINQAYDWLKDNGYA